MNMKQIFVKGAAALVLGVVLAGCQNTSEGAAKDTSQNTEAVKDAGAKAADATATAVDNTAAAVKDAGAKTADAAQKTADRVGSAAQKATGDIAAATKNGADALTLTPKVKAAIIADTELNNTANKINVESGDNKVVLNGNVTTDALKKKAGQIAEKAVKDAGASNTVTNNLTVSKM